MAYHLDPLLLASVHLPNGIMNVCTFQTVKLGAVSDLHVVRLNIKEPISIR